MLMLGFMAAAFFFLYNSKMRFLALGSKGGLYAKWAASSSRVLEGQGMGLVSPQPVPVVVDEGKEKEEKLPAVAA